MGGSGQRVHFVGKECIFVGKECNFVGQRKFIHLGMAGASGVQTAPRALALFHTPKEPHTSVDPPRCPAADPADDQAPAPAAPAPTDPVPVGSACAQEPALAVSPLKAGGKEGVSARGSSK